MNPNTDELRRLLEDVGDEPWHGLSDSFWLMNDSGDQFHVTAADAAQMLNALPALLDERDRLLAAFRAACEMRDDPCASVNYGCNSAQAFDFARAAIEEARTE